MKVTMIESLVITCKGYLTYSLIPLFLLTPLPTDAKTTIQVANWASADELELEEQIAQEFMKLYPDIRVVVESIPNNYKEKIMITMAAGTPPDVLYLDSVIIPTFINRGLLEDLRPFTDEYGVDLSIYYANLLQIAESDGALYAIPGNFTPYVMYYNKTLFDEANLPYPTDGWSWDDYLELSIALTRDTDNDGRIDQFGTVFNNWLPGWIPWVWSNGGDVLSSDGKTASGFLNSSQTEESLKFLIDLRTKYNVAPHNRELSATGGTSSLFFTNRIGMAPSGHWWLMTLRKYIASGDLRIGVVPLPTPDGGQHVTVMYEAGWCVPKGGKHIPEAALVATFFAGETAGRIRAQYGIAIPAIQSLAEEMADADTLGLEAVFVNEIQHCRQPWGTVVEEFSRVEKITQDAVDEVLIGGRDIHTTFTEAAKKIDKAIHKYADSTGTWASTNPGIEIMNLLQGVLAILVVVCLFAIFFTGGKERKSLISGLLFLSPTMIHLVIFVVTPLIFALYLSFHKWNILAPEKPFVGLENFKELLTDWQFWNALKNTAIYSLHVPVGMMISLAIAVLLNQKIRGGNFLRTLYFLPSVSSFVAIALVWTWIYDPQFGLANYILSFFGIKNLGWLTDPSMALISIMIMSIWMGIGFQMVIFLAGLQGIPSYLYEAAKMDGASSWVQFRDITFPLLAPTTFFVLVTSMIGSFQVFSSIYVMTRGGPMRSTDVVVYHIYQNAWEYLNIGYASAMSWVLFIIIVSVTALQFKFMSRGVEYG